VNVNAGKSTVAANLSAVLAQGEKDVILVDADLRRPRVHELVRTTNDYGLTDIYKGRLNITEALKPLEEKFSVIVSGNSSTHPAELLASNRMDHILSQLEDMSDYVIIDSPPFIVTDVIFLADKVDGILIVIRPGQTRKKNLLAMLEQIRRTNARILGVVFNRIPQSNLASYGGYGYFSPYYSNGHYTEDIDQPIPKGRIGKLLLKVQAKTDELLNRNDD
jgi:polysaccharide biosynthesis transport protein